MNTHPGESRQHSEDHHGHRQDQHIHHEARSNHFESHEEVEHHHNEHHYHHHEEHAAPSGKRDRSMYSLPTGFDTYFNQTLFNILHDAPFHIYEDALGHSLESDSFPVFALPEWYHLTGVFSGFSKKASPLIFENLQFLLEWEDIVESNVGVGSRLGTFIEDNNFRANVIIGKSIGDNARSVPFIGMVVSYYQYGSKKNVLVPFARLEDFFDDSSEMHLLNPDTKNLEMDALHELLDQARSNTTHFYHPALAHTEERKAQLEDLEIIHFQKLFQLLIRRSFLFASGYADCLLNEPHGLRQCLDSTFYSIIKMETNVRGALDDQILEQLAEINHTFHSKVSEACISTQNNGLGIIYGSGSCSQAHDLAAFVGGIRSI
eukprot:Nitzschia sp. Nitz4//scaffold90_size81538//40194//41321//NITZ4_005320-RA/size81538-processed-gene-0.50-mRNA-1//-1//CDS//3329560014//7035//frame0